MPIPTGAEASRRTEKGALHEESSMETFGIRRQLGLRYVDEGDSSGADIVLIHGLGNSLYFWHAVVPLLRRRHRIIAMDVPGYGESPIPKAGFSLDTILDDLAALLAALNVKHPVIIGHSLGGAIAGALCADMGTAPTGLVLVNASLTTAGNILADPCAAWTHKRVAVSLIAQFAGGALPMTSLTASVLSRSKALKTVFLRPFVADPRSLDATTLSLALMHNRGRRILAALLIGRKTDLDGIYASVQSPIALVYGTEDWLITKEDISTHERTLHPSDVIRMEGVGHWPMLEQPEAFVAALESVSFMPGKSNL